MYPDKSRTASPLDPNENPSLAIIVSGIAIAYGADENIVQAISGAAVTLVSVVSYIWVEGKIDAAAVDQTADFAKQILSIIDLIEEYQRKRDELQKEQTGIAGEETPV